ncbi:MAG: hypothetical protein JST91_16865 [Actinobacteria bacterium]|nr:hypothetical protein [Actinomycetota bacterium]
MCEVMSPVVELRLLTYRPAEMVAWWAALIGSPPRPLDTRATAVTGPDLGVVIERSQIALDYHPEASGVTAVTLMPGDLEAVRPMVNRLAELGSRPYRATCRADRTTLWFRDPNGTDVAVCLLSDPATGAGIAADGGRSEEVDPADVLARIGVGQPAGDHRKER